MAGRISERSIHDVLARADMLDVVREAVELKKAGTQWKGLCPFHAEKSPSFYVNPANKLFHCKGCGAGGNLLQFIERTRGLAFKDAIEWLAARQGTTLDYEHASPLDQQRHAEAKSRRARMLELHQVAQAWFRARYEGPDGTAARAYADRRGLLAEITRTFGFGAAPSGWDGLAGHLLRRGFSEREVLASGLGVERSSGGLYDRFRDRLMFPIYNAAGDLIAFGGRTLLDAPDVAKYMNSPETTLEGEDPGGRTYHFYKKSHCVFGLFQAKDAIRRSRSAVLVEGNLDVVTLHQAGRTTVVCAMGTALTEEQAREVKRFADAVVLVFDGDAAGRRAALKAVPTVVAAGFVAGSFVLLPDGEDPDSLVRKHGVAAWDAAVSTGKPLIEGWIDAMADCAGSLEARARIENEVLEFVGRIADPVTRRQAEYAAADAFARLGLDEDHGRALGEVQRAAAKVPAHVAAAPLRAGPASRDGFAALQKGGGAGPPRSGLGASPPVPPALLADEDWIVRILAWYPALLPGFQREGGADAIQSPELRIGVHHLGLLARAAPLDIEGVMRWAEGLPDGAVRGAFLGALVEAPAVAARDAERQLRAYGDALFLRRQQVRVDELGAQLIRPGTPAEQLRALSLERIQLQREMSQRKSNLYAAARPGPPRSGV
ncbi:MAG: DNA primase [Myxococcales bacterium]|nr:DNA primase [Myxococcales bacterium]